MGLELLDEYDLFVGMRLRELREERGVMVEDLANYTLTSRQQYYRYETGKNRIPIARVILAAELLNVPLTAFNPPPEINDKLRKKAGASGKDRS
ncbi:helix-turn-helix domain-containing protein [Fulvimarina endophytica]|nr:helix-turn-helix transcriptional regulator [Fulvimarina endophytica]